MDFKALTTWWIKPSVIRLTRQAADGDCVMGLHAGSDRLFVRVHDAVTHSAAIGIGSYATTNGTHAVNGAAEHTVLSMPLLTNDLPLE